MNTENNGVSVKSLLKGPDKYELKRRRTKVESWMRIYLQLLLRREPLPLQRPALRGSLTGSAPAFATYSRTEFSSRSVLGNKSNSRNTPGQTTAYNWSLDNPFNPQDGPTPDINIKRAPEVQWVSGSAPST